MIPKELMIKKALLAATLVVVLMIPITLGTACRCVASDGARMLLSDKLFASDTSTPGALHDYRAMELKAGKPAETEFRVDGLQDGMKFTVRGTVKFPALNGGHSVRGERSTVYVHARMKPKAVSGAEDCSRDSDESRELFCGRFGRSFTLTDGTVAEEVESQEARASLEFQVRVPKLAGRLFSRGHFYRVVYIPSERYVGRFLIETAHRERGLWTSRFVLKVFIYTAVPNSSLRPLRGSASGVEVFWEAETPFGGAGVVCRVSTPAGAARSHLRHKTVAERELNSFREGDIAFQRVRGSGYMDLQPASFSGGRTVTFQSYLYIESRNPPIWRDGHGIEVGFTRKWLEKQARLMLGFLAVVRRGEGNIEVLSGTFLELSFCDQNEVETRGAVPE